MLHLTAMELIPCQYYHLYNRSNGDEIVFRSEENYRYFLQKYEHYFKNELDTLSYCLMPTHFHFLCQIKEECTNKIRAKFGIFLSAYTKAFNIQQSRHGSLFQQHSKARHVDKERYLFNLVTYIHQNPVRAGLVINLEDWEFSSYRDYISVQISSITKTDFILSMFSTLEEFKEYSNTMMDAIDNKYWISR